jgi:hypothetical protein
MAADWEACMAGMPLSKELREGVPQVQRHLIHSIIEFSAMTMQQLLERKRQNQAELAELRRSNPWMAALEEEQAKANACRERIAEVRGIHFCIFRFKPGTVLSMVLYSSHVCMHPVGLVGVRRRTLMSHSHWHVHHEGNVLAAFLVCSTCCDSILWSPPSWSLKGISTRNAEQRRHS